MQVYMSYLINFVERTLGMKDYVMPLAVIIVCSAVLAGLLGFLMDKFGRKHFFIPLVLAAVAGTLGIYLIKFLGTGNSAALLGMLIPVGIVTMTAELSVSGLFVSSFRDYIPKGKEGCFQGIRMFLFVLLPMIIGPAIGNAIIDEYGWYTYSRDPQLSVRDVPRRGDSGGVHPDTGGHSPQQRRRDACASACGTRRRAKPANRRYGR